MSLTQQVRKAALSQGADLVGFASIDRFDGVPAEHHPRSIFPETRTVIVIAKRVARGCIRGVEEGTQFSLFGLYATNWVPDRFLAMTTVSVATFLEDNRWEAVPLPNIPVQAPAMGIPVRPDLPAANVLVDFNDAAVRSGLGQIAYNGEFMTPQFGPRQRLQVILTDAELQADPLCKEAICDKCKQCVNVCPLGAMDTAGETQLDICGLKMTVAKTDWQKCRQCRNGAFPNGHHPSGLPDRTAAICMRTCINHIEEAERVTNRFKNSFRQRPAWQIDSEGRTSLVSKE